MKTKTQLKEELIYTIKELKEKLKTENIVDSVFLEEQVNEVRSNFKNYKLTEIMFLRGYTRIFIEK
jgi:hypothetical protein